MKQRSPRPRSTKPLSNSWNRKIRKVIKETVRDQKEREQITKLLNREKMKIALASLLAEIKKHPKQEDDSENDRLWLIRSVLKYCVISQNMPKDIPACLWSNLFGRGKATGQEPEQTGPQKKRKRSLSHTLLGNESGSFIFSAGECAYLDSPIGFFFQTPPSSAHP